MLGKNREELKVLVDALVHSLHIPQVEREVFWLCVTGTYLALEENQGAGLRNDMSAELSEQEINHMDVALVHLRRS